MSIKFAKFDDPSQRSNDRLVDQKHFSDKMWTLSLSGNLIDENISSLQNKFAVYSHSFEFWVYKKPKTTTEKYIF